MSSCTRSALMAMAAAEPAPAAVITWARGVDGVARPPDTGDAGAPGAIDDREAGVIELAAELGEEVVTVWGVDRPDEHRSTGHDAAIGEFDATQVIVLDHESGDLAMHDADAAGVERRGLAR